MLLLCNLLLYFRKAKQNAYKTMNDAFRIMGDLEDNLDVADNHHSSDEGSIIDKCCFC